MQDILIVDDDPNIALTISKDLEKLGYRSLFLYESEYLFEMLKSRNIDLIFLDLQMPNIDVLSILKSLKNHSRFRNIPVVILADQDDQKLMDCINLGALDFIHKPVKIERLQARMSLISSNTRS